MRILGGVLVVLGLLFCLSFIGAIIGIPMIILGIVLAALGGRRTLITNVVTVQATPAARTEAQPPDSPAPYRGRELPPASLAPQQSLEATTAGYDANKWQVLVRYDDDIRNAVERVRPFGDAYEVELATAYLKINDKTYLEPMVKKIIQEAENRIS